MKAKGQQPRLLNPSPASFRNSATKSNFRPWHSRSSAIGRGQRSLRLLFCLKEAWDFSSSIWLAKATEKNLLLKQLNWRPKLVLNGRWKFPLKKDWTPGFGMEFYPIFLIFKSMFCSLNLGVLDNICLSIIVSKTKCSSSIVIFYITLLLLTELFRSN